MCRGEKIVDDFHKGCLSTVMWANSRLEGFEEVVGLEGGVVLGGDDVFWGFGGKWEVGDKAVVRAVGWVQGGLGFEHRVMEGILWTGK